METSTEDQRKEMAKEWVRRHVTAVLTPRASDPLTGLSLEDYSGELMQTTEDETSYHWHPSRDYFPDAVDPRRDSFVHDLSHMDFNVSERMEFASICTQRAYRRCQLANNIHHCCFTCFKYNPHWWKVQICRFCYEVAKIENCETQVTEVEQKVTKKRKRARKRIQPPRNNGWLNVHIKSPLVVLGHGGNMDCQRIDNVSGAAEYIASYNTKQDEPDHRVIDNLYASKLAKLRLRGEAIEFQSHLRAAANAVISAQHIGTVQACYTLLKLPFVQSSRQVININCEKRIHMAKSIVFKKKDLDQLDPALSAELKGLQSSAGLRDAYSLFMSHQRSLPINADKTCNVSMFSLYSTYSLKEDPNDCSLSKIGLLQDVLDIDVHGFIINPVRFQIDSVIFIPRKTNAVINMAPYISIDLDNERSCYAILLLHVPWPDGGEDFIVNQGLTAVQTLQEVRKHPGGVPPYLESLLTKQKLSQEHLNDFADQYDDQPTRVDLCDDETVENAALQIPEIRMDGDDSDEESFDEIAEAVEANVDEEKAKGTVKSIDQATFQRFANCIKQREQRFKDDYAAKNQLVLTDASISMSSGDNPRPAKVNVDKYETRLIDLEENVAKLQGRQRAAFDTAKAHITGEIQEQLLMFLSGEGGTGKSKVITALIEFTILHFGRVKGFYGAAVGLGPTGSAARNIAGFTWHKVVRMPMNADDEAKMNPTPDLCQEVGKGVHGVQLLVIDEVSMVSCHDLQVFEKRFKMGFLTTVLDEEERKARAVRPFAGVHVLFAGDFYQLTPVSSQSLFVRNPNTKNRPGRELWMKITKFVCLKKNFRLSNNSEGTRALARCLSALRVGNVTQDALDILNSRVAVNDVAIERKTRNKGCLWLAPTRASVKERNKQCLKALKESGTTLFRFFALHNATDINYYRQDDSVRTTTEMCLRRIVQETRLSPVLDLALGSRVRVTRNLAAEVGECF